MNTEKAQLIEKFMQEEKYPEAMLVFKSLQASELQDQDVFNLTICKTATGDVEGAIKDLLGLHRAGSSFPYLYYMLGQLYEKQGNVKTASFFYRKGMEHRETYEESKQAYSFLAAQREIDEESDKIIELKPFKPDINFKDVVGLDNLKKILFRKVILPLQHPEYYKEYGRDLSTGILLYGASGTGKTYLTRAVAGEANAYMLVVKIHQIEGEYVSVSEKNAHAIFEQARHNAPCVIFIDEADVLLGKRSSYGGSDEHGGTGTLRQLSNSLLEEMDGIEKNPEGIFIVASTNRIWDIDPAFRRSGRLGLSLYVPPPTYTERVNSFKFYMAKRKAAQHLAYSRFSKATEGYTQSDIKNLCNEAAEIPAVEKYEKDNKAHRKYEKGNYREIKNKDVLKAIKESKPSLATYFMDARKELVGKYNIQVVDGKEHLTWQSAALEPQEQVELKSLIDDVLKNTNPATLRRRAIDRFLALHIA